MTKYLQVAVIPKILPLIACIAMAACAARYKAPDSGQTADLLIRTTASGSRNMAVVRYTGDEYLSSKGQVVGFLNSVAVGTGPYVSEFSIKVEPGVPFRFSIKNGGNRITQVNANGIGVEGFVCQTQVSFVPAVGQSYEAVHSVDGYNCSISVYRRNNQGSLIPEPSAKHLTTCLDPKLVGSGFRTSLCSPGFKIEEIPERH